MRPDGSGRRYPCRPPELRASGSYSSAPAAIIGYFPLAPLTACTVSADPICTDHGHEDRRDENLHRAVGKT